MANSMGFLASFKKSKSKGKELVKKTVATQNELSKVIDPLNIYLRFDSLKLMTFGDAKHHTLIFGTTGSGKTASVIYPIINNAIKAFHAMIIGDLKGNMGDAVRIMAAEHGRSAEIVEYGSGPLAEKVNSIAFMSDDAVRTFFEGIADEICPDSNGKIWAKKGAQNAADCAILLRFLAKHDPSLEPSLSRIYEMINNPFDASKLYTIFLENYYDKNDEKQRQFVNAVDSNGFHLLKKLEKNIRKEFKAYDADRTYEEQLTWNLQAIKMGLRTFLEAPGIEEHFSAQGAPGIDLYSDIMAGKIILLRFDSLTGKTGSFLIRSLLSESYRIVLKTTLTQRGGKFFHVILDEFQEYADFSDHAGSDKNFIALGRECGACFTASTQSMSSMACKAGNAMPVESFVGNCNNIISFYSHDASTQQLVERYDHKIKLNKLKPGQLFAVHYDSSTRKHLHGIEKLDKAYKDICTLLEDGRHKIEEVIQEIPEEKHSLTVLVDNLIENIEAQNREEAEKRRLIQEKEKQAFLEACAKKYDNIEENDRDDENNNEDEDNIMDEDSYNAIMDKADNNNDNDLEDNYVDNSIAVELCSSFPQLFALGFDEADIPVGWRNFTIKTLHMFAAIGLLAKIEKLAVSQGKLIAILEDGSSFAESVLNGMLQYSSNLCMICGQIIDKCESEPNDAYLDPSIPICNTCQDKYNSFSVERENSIHSI